MTIKIDGLYEIKDLEKIIALYQDAFGPYPKLRACFTKPETRKLALEASLRFYCAYDMRYGKAYALDEGVNEAVLMIESENMGYTVLKHLLAGSYSKKYRFIMRKLTWEERKKRKQLFAELDRLEMQLDLPNPHIYLDFLGVRTAMQGKGKGGKLMGHLCAYADECKRPLMLFTNTQEDVRFYEGLGFENIGETRSKKFGFTNWYMIRVAQ